MPDRRRDVAAGCQRDGHGLDQCADTPEGVVVDERGCPIDSDGDGVLDRNGRPFRFELSTNTDSRIRVDAAVMIQEQLRRVGIDARVQRMEFNTLVDKNLEHDFDATLGAWGIDTSLDLTYAFHTDSIDNGYNFGGFVDPEVDRLLDQAVSLVLGEDVYLPDAGIDAIGKREVNDPEFSAEGCRRLGDNSQGSV